MLKKNYEIHSSWYERIFIFLIGHPFIEWTELFSRKNVIVASEDIVSIKMNKISGNLYLLYKRSDILKEVLVSDKLAQEIYKENMHLINKDSIFKSFFSILLKKFAALILASPITLVIYYFAARLLSLTQNMFLSTYCDNKCSIILVMSGFMTFSPYVFIFLWSYLTYNFEIKIQNKTKDSRYRGAFASILFYGTLICFKISPSALDYLHVVGNLKDTQLVTEYVNRMEVKISDFMKVRIPTKNLEETSK